MRPSIAEKLKVIEYRLRHAEQAANNLAAQNYPDSYTSGLACQVGFFLAEAFVSALDLRHIIEDLTGETIMVDATPPVGAEVDTDA